MLADGIAALRTPLIRVQLSREAAFCLGALAVDPPAREVARDGMRETLEPRVMQVLVLLARHRSRVVSRDDLIEACWDGRIVSENAVNRVMSRIRALAAGIGAEAFDLQTVAKVGYRLVANEVAPDIPDSTIVAPAERRSLNRRATIVGLTAAAGGIALLGWRAASDSTPSAEGAELYRRGVEAQRQGLAEQNVQAVAYLREAVTADPGNATAWGALSLAYRHLLEGQGRSDLDATATAARSAAARALELDPQNADATVALILIPPYFGNWLTMERALRLALRSYPNHWLLWGNLGRVLAETGRWREAVATYGRAVALDPFLPIARARQAATLWGSGRLQEADSAYASAAQRWPSHPAIWFGRFDFLVLSGQPAAAIALAAQTDARPVGVPAASFEHRVRLVRTVESGDTTDAAATIKLGLAAGLQGPESAVQYLAALGQTTDAFNLLANYYVGARSSATGASRPIGALTRRYTDVLFTPPTGSLRGDPRFVTLARVIGLEDYWKASRSQPDYRGTV